MQGPGETVPAESEDGLGESLAEELRWFVRFRRARRRPVPWREPERAEERRLLDHPRWGRFADGVVALADWEGRTWFVMERLWYGWPDGPRYAVFAVAGEAVWFAADFARWPDAWRKPWQSEADGLERLRRAERLDEERRRAARQALVLLLGVPVAFAGWRLGLRLASAPGRGGDVPEAEALIAISAIFALAVVQRICGRRLAAGWRRFAARLRYRAWRRWGAERTRAAFAPVWRRALYAAGLAAAVLSAAFLAGLGADSLDVVLVLVTALALLLNAVAVLRLFSLFGFHPAASLAFVFALAFLAGWLGFA